jgi:muconolactone delta-isomerase
VLERYAARVAGGGIDEMKILALEKELPGVKAEAFQPHLKDEAHRVWELQQSGLLREIYFNSNQHTAVLVLECPSVEEARRLLSTLPLVAAGVIEFEIIPLAPYDGFARLFA